ncbi:hypothetical protein GCM10010234_24960 [Streptomyces hawaiiensis]|uniref:hypothetical protein n=1 Tax=Streptomyces hawaiiensis TaxID=67305 RepID=UPI0031D6FCA4
MTATPKAIPAWVTVLSTPDPAERTVDRVLAREAELLEGLGAERQEAIAGLLRELLGDVQERLDVRGVSHVGHEALDRPEQG